MRQQAFYGDGIRPQALVEHVWQHSSTAAGSGPAQPAVCRTSYVSRMVHLASSSTREARSCDSSPGACTMMTVAPVARWWTRFWKSRSIPGGGRASPGALPAHAPSTANVGAALSITARFDASAKEPSTWWALTRPLAANAAGMSRAGAVSDTTKTSQGPEASSATAPWASEDSRNTPTTYRCRPSPAGLGGCGPEPASAGADTRAGLRLRKVSLSCKVDPTDCGRSIAWAWIERNFRG